MHDETIQDDILFDRLVDGDLSAGERRRLLESLDMRPDGWRRCALAFLEAQSWREDLGQLVRDGSVDRADHATASASPASSNRQILKSATTWLAIAAGLLVAFNLGVMRHDNGRQVVNRPSNSANDPLVVAPPTASQSPSASRVDDALTLWVRDDKGQPQRLRVPLVDAGALDRQLGVQFQSGLPANVRSQLLDRGYNVESKRRYAPLWLEDGNPMILPVEDTKIVPVSQRVY
jgi:hypothetical protein